MFKYKMAVMLFLLLFFHGTAYGSQNKIDLSGETLIIDVRTVEEYQTGHIKGSINIPLPELAERIRIVVPDYNEEIILYCRSGRRSDNAKQVLEGMGYKRVINGGAFEDLVRMSGENR